eukprot:TRINITY_DN3265_c0_g4_i2.p1 TRINITY_DN3265_c0_g4~~TRINITY_DN3265_c0_g4_i2.p1  ORF type:complete len:4140 (+),score=1212.96 TRINITY_DN3265_c0_g4_i2:30-12449(+)
MNIGYRNNPDPGSLPLMCEPKVVAPRIPEPGKAPREVLIERLRRLYAAQDMKSLLAKEGVFYHQPTKEELELLEASNVSVVHTPSMKRYLPLALFDDKNFDERPFDSWLNLGFSLQDGSKYVPGQVRLSNTDQWLSCQILSYDGNSDEYTVKLGARIVLVPQIDLLILGSSPFLFAKRVRKAHTERAKAESRMRYFLCVESMPVDDIDPLPVDTVDKILKKAAYGIDTSKMNYPKVVEELLREVQLDYCRVNNRLIFDKVLHDNSMLENLYDPSLEELITVSDELTIEANERRHKDKGRLDSEGTNFNKVMKSFRFHSFLTHPHAVTALQNVQRENYNILQHTLFHINASRTFKIGEFEQLELQSIQNGVSYLRDTWLQNLKVSVEEPLSKTEKGWFNIQGVTFDTFEHSKLKEFLRALRYQMEDTLRNYTLNSLQKYCEMINQINYAEVIIHSCNKIQLISTKTHETIETAAIPMFQLDLVINERSVEEIQELVKKEEEKILKQSVEKTPIKKTDEKDEESNKNAKKEEDDKAEDMKEKPIIKSFYFGYSLSLSEVEKLPVNIFDEALSSLRDIPQLQSILLPGIQSSSRAIKQPVLCSVHNDDPEVLEYRRSIISAMSSAIMPLWTYLKTFSIFEELINVDIKRLEEELQDEEEYPLQKLVEMLERNLRLCERVPDQIDHSVVLSGFQISTIQIRNQIIAKYNKIVETILDTMIKRGTKKCEGICNQYEVIYRKVLEKPKNIEQLTEIRQYIDSIPDQEVGLHQEVNEMVSIYSMLEKYNYQFTDAEFKLRWKTFAWSKNIEEVVEKNQSSQEKYDSKFRLELKKGQEAFSRRLNELAAIIGQFNQNTDLSRVEENAVEVKKIQHELKTSQQKVKEFNSREALFKLPQTEYLELPNLIQAFEPFADLWLTARDWSNWHNTVKTASFQKLDAKVMEENVQSWVKTLNKTCRALKDHPQCFEIANEVKAEVAEFSPHVPLLVALRSPGMRERHWKNISEKIGFDLNPSQDENFTLDSVFELKLPEFESIILKETDFASKEFFIEESLLKMKKEWEEVKFYINPYGDTNTFTMGGVDEIVQLLDDHIVMTQAMSFSPFKKPFEDDIAEWEALLKSTSDIIEEWVQVQANWMYLEPIFSSADIIRQLPREHKTFSSVDHTWRRLMNTASKDPLVLSFCKQDKLYHKFKECNQSLDQVQRGLSAYLESKCAVFGRFYFLSDNDLLMILSQTKDPQAVQPHLKKCFENLHKIEFGENNGMSAMFSGEDEKVDFVETIYPTSNVEDWMCDIEKIMQASIKHEIEKGISTYADTARTDWVLAHAAQIVLAVSQIWWTRDVEKSIISAKLSEQYLTQLKQIEDLTQLVRSPLSKLNRKTLSSLITIDVHARDVVEKLKNEDVTAINAFEWVSNMRYYWADDDCYVRMVQSNIKYGYEYLGNTSRLVITPLTDRIYMTLMGAVHLNLGGSPQGPAGTGKTETVKDLSKALANYCYVLNCSDGLDFLAMEKFFKGLVSVGAWACFDEFNRIDIEVLSVIAQQLATIYNAIREQKTKFNFGGSEMPLNPRCAVFITMNPGYAGRTELPDNLKAQFRPIAVMVPDYGLIAEIRLFSFGFSEGRSLAQKMVGTFKLSSEQLSSQFHYDFGMRAVNTVIAAAGEIKRQSPELDENVLLLRALRDCNLPKFLRDDIPLFNGIISDLFPGVKPPVNDYGTLHQAVLENIAQSGLQPLESFIQKVFQLYETILLRHGLMLVGPTGGGKSCCMRTLQGAMTSLKGIDNYSKVNTLCLNPKAVTMDQLYGGRDPNTLEWYDGVLAKAVRQAATDTTDERFWIVCDGPVDAVWIENMNTVLDDNKKLCLANGQVIPLTSRMNMIFEVEDLSQASPATVSRCGMVYMEPSYIGLSPLIQSWIATIPSNFEEHAVRIQANLNSLITPLVEYIRHDLSEVVSTVDSNLCKSALNIMDSFMLKYQPPDEVTPVPEEMLERIPRMIDPLCVFSVIWSVGGALMAKDRLPFDKFLRDLLKDVVPDIINGLPTEGTLFDYLFDEEKESWISWIDTIPAFKIEKGTAFSNMIVPVTENIAMSYLIEQLSRNGSHILAVGETGTGKSVTVKQTLADKLDAKYIPLFVNFSAQTSANQTQDVLDSKFEKRRNVYYGPPLGKKAIIFVDDLNMPMREKYGAQPPIELIRQYMDYGGWYDRKALYLKQIVDCHFVSAMGPPGGGRNPVTNRLLRHYNFLSFPELSNKSLKSIFTTIMNHTYTVQGISNEVKSLVETVVEAGIKIYGFACDQLLPTPAKSHYTFNLRDLSSIIQGMLMCDPKYLVSSKYNVIKSLIHENLRVFADRLINDTDRVNFSSMLEEIIQKDFKMSISELGESTGISIDQHKGQLQLMFTVNQSGTGFNGYAEVIQKPKLISSVEETLRDYNEEESAPMKLIMFENAVAHVCRISRIISQPQGNALLLGVGGSGRRSLTRLAAHMCGMQVFNIEVSKNYGKEQWRENLMQVLRSCGLDEKPTVFLFADTQIVDESFVEDINNILNTGEIPNLFDEQELDQIYNTMRPLATSLGIIPTKLNLFNLFTRRVRHNIHVVLCFSPMGEEFRSRLRQFPSLVNCCTIDWFTEWPEEALLSVAKDAFIDTRFEEEDNTKDAAIRNAVVEMCVEFHQSVQVMSKEYLEVLRRHNYVTPTSYLELLNLLKKLLVDKRSKLTEAKIRLQAGISTIENTSKSVDVLQQSLAEQIPKLEQESIETEKMIENIGKQKVEAQKIQEVVQKEEKEVAIQAKKCQEIADEAAFKLGEAYPVLQNAQAALSVLNASHFRELAAYNSPPEGVKLVMHSICIMKGVKAVKAPDPNIIGKRIDDWWTPSKQLLNNSAALMDSLMHYDRDNIDSSIISKITAFIDNPEYDPAKLRASSKACESMAAWVIAIYKYHNVKLTVIPLEKEHEAAKAELEKTESALQAKRSKLKAIEDKISNLEADLHEKQDHKLELEKDVQNNKDKVTRAEKLLASLGDEKERWEEEVKKLSILSINVVGDILISSGAIAYLGAFTSDFREKLINQWCKKLEMLNIPYTHGVNLIDTLGDPVEIRKWTFDGLPSDRLSTENAIILTKGNRWGLMIDPQGQANQWIKQMYSHSETGLDVLKLTDKDLARNLENAIRFGRAVLIENVGESLPPMLEPLLLKQTISEGGRQAMIKLGDHLVSYNEDFRLYMTTKLSNPHYSPETSVKVSLLNFTITQSGLEDQLLAKVVVEERPELEQAKNKLIKDNAAMIAELRQTEDDILALLARTSQNAILEDDRAIDILAGSKKVTVQIHEKVAQAEITEREIDETRSKYIPAAQRSAVLYFCVADMANIDPMYQYSLQWFIRLFINAIHDADEAEDLNIRAKNIAECFTYSLYNNICRSLFENHKLMFSFLMTSRIMQFNGEIDQEEWRFLVSPVVSTVVPYEKPYSWLTDKVWNDICALDNLPAFKGIAKDFIQNEAPWKNVFDSNNSHKESFSSQFSKLSSLQRLLVIKCLRPDKEIQAIQMFVTENLGSEFIVPPTFNLAGSFKESSSTTPLIFVLSPGANPASDLFAFADQMRHKLLHISLGQGQGEKAAELIKQCCQSGAWVLLQNCHLSSSWMPTLEMIVESFNPDIIRPDFRLWLTSMPSPTFPVSVLQNGIKMTNEPPRGIRANLLRSYNSYESQFLQHPDKPNEFKKLLYSLSLFHAIVQERRKFGALGWNIPYEFTTGDLTVCTQQLNLFLSTYDEIPFKVLKFLFGEINYGGRVTDEWDRRTLMTIIQDYMTPGCFTDGYSFGDQNEDAPYASFTLEDLDSYLKHIDELPLEPHPETFGLHANADITYANNETLMMFDTLLSLQPRTTSSGGLSRDDVINQTASSILSSVAKPFNYEEVAKHYPTLYEESMNTVLQQEVVRFNGLLERVHSTLHNLIKALKGEVVLSLELEAMGDSLFNNLVPELWSQVAYPSLKPLSSWVQDLQLRINFLQRWIDEGAPAVFWMSGFFFPQAFLTGTLQNFARKYVVSIDTISFAFDVLDQTRDTIKEGPEDGCYVDGLFLEGAAWSSEKKSLVDSKPKELIDVFPIIHFRPVANREIPSSGIYNCPCYKTLTRAGTLSTTGHSTNFVVKIEVPSNKPEKYWIKRGVALICALRY